MLTDEQTDFIFESIGNYIEVAHGVEIQPYFEPIISALDSGIYKRIAISSPHSIGKTFMMGRIVDAIMGSFDDTKLVSTAPSHRQVHALLWKEIADAYTTKPKELQRGKLNEIALWVNPKTYAQGFSPQKRVQSDTGQGTNSVFQGYHGEYMTVVIFDEATGIEPQIWKQAEGLLTQGYRVLFIAIGNPTSRNCEFFKCFQSRSWKTFSVSCFDTPNLKANNINSVEDIQREADYVASLPKDEALAHMAGYKKPVPYILDLSWVIDRAIEWGVDHPLFMGKVLGKFPDADGDVLVSEDDIKTSQAREESNLEKETIGYIGLDVARFGVDKSALTSIIEHQQTDRLSMSKNDTNQVVGKTINFIEDHQERYPHIKKWRLAIDGGFGHGVIDRLKELKEDESDERVFKILESVEILEINFGGQDWVMFHYGWVDEFTHRQRQEDRKVQEDRENYCNYKSKMFDLLARDIKRSLKLLSDDIYFKQLPTIKKDVDSKGRLKIESKEDYKKRTGETSPDEADSLALANFAKYFAVQESSYDFYTQQG
jgi:hypothetical protein